MAEKHPPGVVTIDGPSGSGKGTISRAIAQSLGFHFLDSGALYRILALAAQRRGIPLDDALALADLVVQLDIRFPSDEQDERILLEGEDVEQLIRSEEAGKGASRVASVPEVRKALLQRQRDFRVAPGLVADGRDMGTVVFPRAVAKIFLTASAEVRADRRCKQLIEKGNKVDYAAVLADIQARDERDSSRAVAPLVPAEDAVLLDTTHLDIPTTIQRVYDIVKNRLNP